MNNQNTDAKTHSMNRVRELMEMGKTKGALTYKEIMDHLSDTDIDPDQFEKILEGLEGLGIDVINEVPLIDVEPMNEPTLTAIFRAFALLITITNPIAIAVKALIGPLNLFL